MLAHIKEKEADRDDQSGAFRNEVELEGMDTYFIYNFWYFNGTFPS